MRKRSVTIDGHRTSVSLEDAFWTELTAIARRRGLSLAALVALPACGGSSGGGGGSSDAKPGGTLYILTQGEAITHLDPQRNYTGSDLAFAGSTMHRTLTT